MSERLGWWRRSVPGLAGLVLILLIGASLLFGAFAVYATITAERAERAQVARTSAVLDALRDIGLATINAETGQRGYLMTLDRRYLAPYRLGAAAYPEALRRLRGTLAAQASAEQRRLMDRVERVADAKFAEMAETVSLVDDGRVLDARALVLSDEGQDLMVELRATLAELERIESELLRAAARESARSEARTLPLLGWLIALIVVALALGLWLVSRMARAEAAAANAAALAEARDRADLLARELNHRVRNLFAVILALVRMSDRNDPAARPVVAKIAERIESLARAHEVTQGSGDQATADLGALVAATLKPYLGADVAVKTGGDPVELPVKLVTPLGLVLHELVTNAVKYGALGPAGGELAISWRRDGGRARLEWRETFAAPVPAPGTQGFGSLLMSSSARQLGGRIDRKFDTAGMTVEVEFVCGE